MGLVEDFYAESDNVCDKCGGKMVVNIQAKIPGAYMNSYKLGDRIADSVLVNLRKDELLVMKRHGDNSYLNPKGKETFSIAGNHVMFYCPECKIEHKSVRAAAALIEDGVFKKVLFDGRSEGTVRYRSMILTQPVIEELAEEIAEIEKDTIPKERAEPKILELASNKSTKAVREQLANGVDVNITSNSGATALHIAAHNQRVGICRLLISLKADVNARTNDGETPLHRVAESYSQSSEMIIEDLMKAGAEVNVQDNYGVTPLHIAAREGSESVAEILIKHGASIDIQSKAGKTPLHYAADYGEDEIAELLIERGCKVEVKDNDGYTPFLYAVESGNSDTIELLLTNGADVNSLFPDGEAPLHRAATEYFDWLAEMLLDAGADPNTKDNDGFTPLHYAALIGNTGDTTKLLLDRRADVNAKNNGGLTPVELAKKMGHKEMIALLLSK